MLTILIMAVLIVLAVTGGTWSTLRHVHWLESLEPARPEYHYRHCKTCDYTYLVSSEYPIVDPGCPACGDEFHTETTGLLHKYIAGKWQDIARPPRLDPVTAGLLSRLPLPIVSPVPVYRDRLLPAALLVAAMPPSHRAIYIEHLTGLRDSYGMPANEHGALGGD